jgi:hypothetical protein
MLDDTFAFCGWKVNPAVIKFYIDSFLSGLWSLLRLRFLETLVLSRGQVRRPLFPSLMIDAVAGDGARLQSGYGCLGGKSRQGNVDLAGRHGSKTCKVESRCYFLDKVLPVGRFFPILSNFHLLAGLVPF